jgi:pimeloyl-ACP methyl ester carboxylesterase
MPSPALPHREILAALPDEDEDRPPLLFVHGLGHGAWCFQEHWLAGAAARGYPSYAVSLRGHGGSGGAKRLRRTLMRDYVHDIQQAIVELPSPPVLVGHSMGGLLAQLVAERYPLRGLVLLASAPAGGAVGTLVSIAAARPLAALTITVGGTLPLPADVLFEGLDHATAERYADRVGRESPLVQYELLRPRRIGPVRCPVLVVGTPDDRVIRPVDVEHTAAMYGVDPVWLPGIGHDVMLDAGWERALTTVLDWVDEQVPAGTPPLGPLRPDLAR